MVVPNVLFEHPEQYGLKSATVMFKEKVSVGDKVDYCGSVWVWDATVTDIGRRGTGHTGWMYLQLNGKEWYLAKKCRKSNGVEAGAR